MVVTETTSAAQATVFWTELTPLERQVGTELAQGWTNAKIAARLRLSPKTVSNQVSTMYEKLPDTRGVDRRVRAALLIDAVLCK